MSRPSCPQTHRRFRTTQTPPVSLRPLPRLDTVAVPLSTDRPTALYPRQVPYHFLNPTSPVSGPPDSSPWVSSTSPHRPPPRGDSTPDPGVCHPHLSNTDSTLGTSGRPSTTESTSVTDPRPTLEVREPRQPVLFPSLILPWIRPVSSKDPDSQRVLLSSTTQSAHTRRGSRRCGGWEVGPTWVGRVGTTPDSPGRTQRYHYPTHRSSTVVSDVLDLPRPRLTTPRGHPGRGPRGRSVWSGSLHGSLGGSGPRPLCRGGNPCVGSCRSSRPTLVPSPYNRVPLGTLLKGQPSGHSSAKMVAP